MRIGLFTDQYYPSVSGVVTSIKMLYEGLESLGHECVIFTSFNEKKISKEELEIINQKNVVNFKGISYPFKSLKEFRFTFFTRRFVKVIKKYNLDVIHIQTEYSIAKIAIKASKKLHIPIVHTLHTSWKDYIQYLFPQLDKGFHKQLLWLERNWFTAPVSKASEIEIVPTKKVIQDLSLYGIDKKVEIVPTGIELERFDEEHVSKEDVESLRSSLGIEKDEFVFSYVGRASKEKSINVIIDGFRMAFSGNPKVKLLIVGGGPVLEELMSEADKDGITKNIIFTDSVPWDKVPVYYHMTDVFINASKTETQGLTYIESLASGTPALVQKDEVIEGVVIDNYNGYIFDGVDSLVEKMKYIVDHKEELESLKDNCYKSIQSYSKEHFSKNILEIYKKAINDYKGKREN